MDCKDIITNAWRAARCFWAPDDALIAPGECQADTPHLLDVAKKKDPSALEITRDVASERSLADRIVDFFVRPDPEVHFGSRLEHQRTMTNEGFDCPAPWENVFVCEEFVPEVPWQCLTTVTSAVVCSRPHWFNTGAHRAIMIAWHEGERYAMAVEEAWPPMTENLFIGAFTSVGQERLFRPGTPETILRAAVIAMTGHELDFTHHQYRITSTDTAGVILDAGCTPSDKMYSY